MSKKYMVIGGFGFIGSHLVRKLLREEQDITITIYDNFSSGQRWHLESVKDDDRMTVVEGDIKDIDYLVETMKGHDVIYSLASNPDIARAVKEPDIDFWEGTYLINNTVEAMRRTNVKNLIYASGSGVYGDVGHTETGEDFSPLLPISTYGASKLACEALISAYCYMFDMNAAVFRFANVVGPNQTHGVGFDFIKKLKTNPNELQILGDGSQSKSYIYVTDILNAITHIEKTALKGFSYYNVATLDYISVKEIADIVVEVMGLQNVEYQFTGGDRGWKGDVPVVRLNSQKIRNTGWSNQYTAEEAIRESVTSMYTDMFQD